jgi:hypothetical protein
MYMKSNCLTRQQVRSCYVAVMLGSNVLINPHQGFDEPVVQVFRAVLLLCNVGCTRLNPDHRNSHISIYITSLCELPYYWYPLLPSCKTHVIHFPLLSIHFCEVKICTTQHFERSVAHPPSNPLPLFHLSLFISSERQPIVGRRHKLQKLDFVTEF